MVIKINEKEYGVCFGIGFLRELDEKYYYSKNGMKFGASLELKIPLVLAGDTVTLSDILYAGTCTEKSRPEQKDIDSFIDSIEDLDSFFDEVIEELKKSNATRVQVTRIHEAIKAAELEEKKEE